MKPISFRRYVAVLQALGLVLVRTRGSHQVWDFPPGSGRALLRPIIIRDKDKEIPVIHVQSNLLTLRLSIGLTKEAFEALLRDA